jgi:hypothetical protein
MHTTPKMISKREFVQHTSKYLQEEHNQDLVITHRNKPNLIIAKIKHKTFKDLQGITEVKIYGDINAHIL